jgi:CBS domain-containing protein
MRDGKAELVRIDSGGVAHPIGAIASQRLRAREGTYRMLPAPEHVVFMRYTGEDGRRDAEDGAIVRLAGEVTAPGALCDVLALLGQTGWRGELVVLDGDDARSVFFDQGNVVGAVTNVETERLGSVLYRYGVIDADARDRVMEVVKQGKRFGEAAIELGVLTQDQIYSSISKQVDEIVFAIMTVGDGTFFFLDNFDEARLVSRHTVSANALLMDGVTRMDEMRYFRQKIPSAEHLPVKNDGRGAPDDEFKVAYAAVDGRSSIGDIGRVSGLGEFEITKQVYGLVQSGHVSIHPPRAAGGPTALVAAANGALTAIFRVAASAGRAEEVRSGLSSFAVGAGVYDMLFRNAGPDASGALDAEAVAHNSAIVAGGGAADNLLKQMLHEYVAFALFSAGAALGSSAEAELSKQVGPALQSLKPQA